ncbi:MAG TPA: alpha/beta hydrolase [Solirubrobacteraceae bacterium]|jgi:pimeloyl-ACP methyl ester carboxylesterase|nr:alpha/beta hydrolase [Solirubrobacteraceae bacterium]
MLDEFSSSRSPTQPVNAAAQWTARSVVFDGATYRYWEVGEGEPLVIFHGGGGLDLAPAYAALGRGARVLCFELPGFGVGSPDPGLETYREIANLMFSVVSSLLGERFSLLGVSFGGAIAAWLAAQSPAAVDRLVLVAPAALRHADKLPSLSPEGVGAALRAHPERGGPEPVADDASKRQVALVQRVWSASADDELEAVLDGLEVPTLIVFGTRDGLIPPDTGNEYKRLLPRSTFALVYDAAHEVAWDRPEAFVDLVADFLRRGDAHVVTTASRLINR